MDKYSEHSDHPLENDKAQTPEPAVHVEHPHLPRNETEAVSKLYQEYFRELSGNLRAMYGDGPPDPDDVAQQAFQKLIERGDVASIANIKAFVWRTARNLIFSAKRADAVRSKYEFEVKQTFFPVKSVVSTPESIIEARDQLKAITTVLLKMPKKRQRAFVLHRIEGLSLTEVGRRLGISRSTVAQHIARAAADIDILAFSNSKVSQHDDD